MKKFFAALVAGLFAAGAFAQASPPATAAPAPTMQKQPEKSKHAAKHRAEHQAHHAAKTM